MGWKYLKRCSLTMGCFSINSGSVNFGYKSGGQKVKKNDNLQKQPFAAVFQNCVLTNFAVFTRKHVLEPLF